METRPAQSGRVPLQVKKSVIQWVLQRKNFSSNKIMTYGDFPLGFDDKTSWYLDLKPCIRLEDGMNAIVYLMPSTKPVAPIHTKYKLGLLTKNGEERDVSYFTQIFTSESDCGYCGKPKFIKLDSLLNEENGYFKDDKVTIFCALEVYKSAEGFEGFEIPKPTFKEDFNELRKTGEFSDVTLVIEGKEEKAHKFVLAARSEVFASLFRDKEVSRVEMEGSLAGVKGLLEFIYSGEVKKLREVAETVLPAADKYGMKRLKMLCEQDLSDDLTPQNLTDILELAVNHKARELEEEALTFFAAHSAQVTQQSSFAQFKTKNPELFEKMRKQVGKLEAKRQKLG